MLSDWLKCTPESGSYSTFEVIRVEEHCARSEQIVDHVSQVVAEARISASLVQKMEARLGWSRAKKIMSGMMPTRSVIRRGDFGEALTQAILTELHGYQVPVSKLRYKVTSEDTLHGTDVVGIKLDENGEISEFCYAESKFRTGHDNDAAIDAHDQLAKDYGKDQPDILTFVLSTLEASGSDLLGPLLAYMADRRDSTDRDSFRITLFWEASSWNERVLRNLEAHGVNLEHLCVHPVRIGDLKGLTDTIFQRLGIAKVIEDE